MRFLKKGKLSLLFFLGAFTQLTPELFDSFNNWLLFFGSFHPALIHFPIGFWTATILVLFINEIIDFEKEGVCCKTPKQNTLSKALSSNGISYIEA